MAVNLTVTPGDADERIFGLGQGDWNQGSTGCGTPRNKQVVVPLERNGPYEHTKSNHYPTGISVNTEDSHSDRGCHGRPVVKRPPQHPTSVFSGLGVSMLPLQFMLTTVCAPI